MQDCARFKGVGLPSLLALEGESEKILRILKRSGRRIAKICQILVEAGETQFPIQGDRDP